MSQGWLRECCCSVQNAGRTIQSPRKGARGFPINRYILENIELAERNAALEGRGGTEGISEAINAAIVDYLQPLAPPMEETTIKENIELAQQAALEGRGGDGGSAALSAHL